MTEIHQTSGRQLNLDLLRIFCCLCIIGIHQSGLLNPATLFSLGIQAVVRPALWVFVLVSGYFILGSPIKSLRDFYLKRIPKILIPLIIYAFVYQAEPYIYLNRLTFASIADAFRALDLTPFIQSSNFIPHFWFVYTLIGAYLVAPFVQRMLDNLNTKQLSGFMILLIIFEVVVPYISDAGFPIAFSLPINGIFFFYFILGYYLKRVNILRFRKIIILLGIINLPLIMYLSSSSLFGPSMHTSSIFMIIGAVFYWTLFSMIHVGKNKVLSFIITFISERTYGIYLIHFMILQKALAWGLLPFTEQNLQFMSILLDLVVFLISLVTASFIDCLISKPILWLFNKAAYSVVSVFTKPEAAGII